MSLTIYFNGQYWCGAVEYYNELNQWVVREYVFGAEPKTEDIFKFINNILPELLEAPWFAYNVDFRLIQQKKGKINPKRLQRIVNKEKNNKGLSSKSQETIRLQYEEKKKVSKKAKKERKELYKREQFAMKQAKKRQKHKGH